jgi:hypothetical protein
MRWRLPSPTRIILSLLHVDLLISTPRRFAG